MAFTKEQQKAVDSRGSNILVSAGAGSGKTTVLVARIIKKVINEKVDIDKLLVSTFTKAAASEMKERLLKSIYAELEKNPEDENLQKQIGLINHAHISTIHSFCLDVIKNNFFETELSANIRIGDTNETEIMKDEAIEKIFQDKYEKKDERFINLLNLYTKYGDDSNLKNIIMSLSKFIGSVPYPEKWLEEAVERFNTENKKFEDSQMAILIVDETKGVIEKAIEELIEIKNMLLDESELIDCYNVIRSDIESLKNIDCSNFKTISESVAEFEWGKWSQKRKFSSDGIVDLKNETKNMRDKVKTKVNNVMKNYFSDTYNEINSDIEEMYPILVEIKNILLEFEEEYTKRKREKNIIDYNDIEHITLNLLVDENGERTEIAKRYDFNEVLVDEYQDINLVQERILSSVSNGNNMFMVGDVKQCIYRFRKARPDLFLNKYRTYSLIEDDDENTKNEELDINRQNLINENREENSTNYNVSKLEKETKIQLYKNFRSRQNVIDFINILFQNLMSEENGGINYDKNEYLNFSASFEEPKVDCKTEMNLIEVEDFIENGQQENKKQEEVEQNKKGADLESTNIEDDEDCEIIDNAILEARLLTKKIRELHNQGINYRDMVILLRSIKVTGPTIEKELIEAGIPVFSDAPTNYLESIEINTIISLLKIIDNPLQDIPLVTVMRSMIGGFNENELTEIRLNKREGAYYYALKETEKSDNIELAKKSKEFIDMIEHYKNLEKELRIDELIWTIYSETGYYYYVRLMPNGNIRQANLRKMFEKAKDYEQISFKGLFNFITFMEKIGERNSSGLEEAKMLSETDDVVRIMTIHKSKGLEFPIVFLSGIQRRFNFQDEKKEFVYDQDLGIGFDFKKEGIKYPTLSKNFIKEKLRKEQIAEEMRILYVALTRAKEKLIITGVEKDIEKRLDDKYKKIQKFYGNDRPNKIDSMLLEGAKNYLDWFEFIHEYNNEIEMDLNIINKNELKTMSNNNMENENSEFYLNKTIDKEKYEKIDELLSWKYEFEKALNAPSKTSVTALKNSKLTFEEDNVIIEVANNLTEDNMKEINISEENIEEKNNCKKEEMQDMNSIVAEVKNKNIKINKALLNKEEEDLTPAEKGSLVHLVLQKLKNTEIEDTIKNLNINAKSKEYLTENIEIFENYINSSLFKELQTAKEVQKETPFYMYINYDDTDEKVLIQGIIDLYYINKNDELILVDYKTDKNVDESILKERYYNQLSLYKKALEKSMKRKIMKMYIYSTTLNKEVEI